MNPNDETFLDAGIFIGAIMKGDPREPEAYPIVEATRQGDIRACTTVGVLSEVYAGLTWVNAPFPLTPDEARMAIAELVEAPSPIRVLSDGLEAALLHVQIASRLRLTARRIHDARHAATALQNGVTRIFTYDPDDWSDFQLDGIVIAGPPSTLARLSHSP
jgi:predicted nucleic acid-binding protein